MMMMMMIFNFVILKYSYLKVDYVYAYNREFTGRFFTWVELQVLRSMTSYIQHLIFSFRKL